MKCNGLKSALAYFALAESYYTIMIIDNCFVTNFTSLIKALTLPYTFNYATWSLNPSLSAWHF